MPDTFYRFRTKQSFISHKSFQTHVTLKTSVKSIFSLLGRIFGLVRQTKETSGPSLPHIEGRGIFQAREYGLSKNLKTSLSDGLFLYKIAGSRFF